MDDSFIEYLQHLELMAFFSGYPLVYALVSVIAGNKQSKTSVKRKFVLLLPYAYALVGTFFLGLQLRNLYPDFSIENIRQSFQQPVLKLWGLLAILFWIPVFARKRILSFLHSLVFFFLLMKDLLFQLFSSSVDRNIIRNDMKIYTDSLLLNLVVLIMAVIVSFLIRRFLKKGISH